MFYESYVEKILKVAKVKDFFHRFRILFISIFALITLLTSGYLTTKGMIIKEITVSQVVKYGDKIDCDAKALFTRIEYEFKHEDSNTWSTIEPTQLGQYEVRAVAKKSFGRKSYSDVASFEVLPQALTITIDSNSVIYGDQPSYSTDGLVKGDKIQEIEFTFENVMLTNTNVSLDVDNIKIVNSNGHEVTKAYVITCEDKNVNIDEVDLVIKLKDITKEYDGQPFVYDDSYEVVSGKLAFDDKLSISTLYSKSFYGALNVGTYENRVVSSSLYNNSKDVSGKYNVTFETGNIIITQREITIKTPSKTKAYDGTYLQVNSASECEVIKGSLASGHKLQVVSSASIKHVGTQLNDMNFMIVDKNGNDVTRNYIINFDYGTLEVVKKDIVVTLGTIEKPYDGSAYRDITSFDLSEKLFSGDRIQVIAEAKDAKNVGTYDLEIAEINFTSGYDGGSIDDYNFIHESGKLKIIPRPVTISPLNYNITYGEYFKDTSFTNLFSVVEDLGAPCYDVSSLIDNSDVELEVKFEDLNGKSVNPAKNYLNAGDYNIIITSHNSELNKNYDISYAPSTLRVNKRDVVLTAAKLPNKEYDSTIFTYPNEQFNLYDANTDKEITGFSGQIFVRFLQYGSEVEPRNAGTYQIEIIDYSNNFNTNYNVNYSKRVDFTIDPCLVELSYVNPLQTKIYDDEEFVDYDLTFNLKSSNKNFSSPFLFNSDMVTLASLYTVYEDPTPGEDYSNIPINAGRYTVECDHILVIDEHGTDVSSNYRFEYTPLVLEITKRRIEITPNSDEIEYMGNEYHYDETSFITKDLDGNLEISQLIDHLDAYINVKYILIDEAGNELYEAQTMYAGDYIIRISEHSNDLNRNFNVSYGDGHLKVTPCNVMVNPTYFEKVYDGTDLFENKYTLTSKYGTFDAPWLFGDEQINNDEISFYLGDYEGNPVSAINVGSYYLHVKLDSIKVVVKESSTADIDALVNNSYVFDYEPIEVNIIPRDVTIIARPEYSKAAYSGEVVYYNNDLFTVSYDNGMPSTATNLIDNSQLKVYVKYYDSKTDGELIDQINVKNARKYYIEVDYVEFITGLEENYNIIPGDRVMFEIIPVDVDIRLTNTSNTQVFNGQVFNGEIDYYCHRTTYKENALHLGATRGLLNGDDISIKDAIKFYDYDTGEESDGINAGKYTVKVDTNLITFISGGNDSVITNYDFSNSQTGYCTITKRTISISAIDQGSVEYSGKAYDLYDPKDYFVKDLTESNMDYDLLLALLEEYDVTVTPVYKGAAGSTYEPVNAGKYSIDVEINSVSELFKKNFTCLPGAEGLPQLNITKKYVVFKPVEQYHGFDDTPFNYPETAYELIEGTNLCTSDSAPISHYAKLEVYYMKDGVVLETSPKDVYGFYEIYIKSVKIYNSSIVDGVYVEEEVTSNYDIEWYQGNDVYLNIFHRTVTVQLNQQESVYYGQDYTFDPFDITTDGGLEGSEFKVNIHYTYSDGRELPDDQKYHPTNAGNYKIVIDSVVVLGKYPSNSYNIEIISGNESFEIMKRSATIAPVINEELTYNFGEAIDYTYSFADVTPLNLGINSGILAKDFSNISFDLIINYGMTTEFTNAGEYTILIDEASLTGTENYEITTISNDVYVNELGIKVKLLDKSKVYDGTSLAFADEYKIYSNEKDITSLLDVYISVTYNGRSEIINAGKYTASIKEFYIYNYDISNFDVSTVDSIYEILKANISISYNNLEQVFTYDGKEIEFDDSFKVDPSTPLAIGDEITLITQFKDNNGQLSYSLPAHAGNYEGYAVGCVDANGAQNYTVTAKNSVKVTVKHIEIVLSLLDKTHYYSGETYNYPTVFNSNAEEVYKVDGYVVLGESFSFTVSYYDINGNKVDPRYVGTYEMVLMDASIKTYINGIYTSYQDYIITIGDNATLTIEENYINTDTFIEGGLNTYEYDATSDYTVETVFTPDYYLSDSVEIKVSYSYYKTNYEELYEKPVNAGDYYVKINYYQVYVNGKINDNAYDSIIVDTTEYVLFTITKRIAYLYVQQVEKTYDGMAFDQEIPVILERILPGHELTYSVSYLDAPYNEIIDVREGGYRVSIDRDSIMFTESSLMDNYEIIVYDAVIQINPLKLFITPLLTFEKEYDGLDVEYDGTEWKYADDTTNRPVGSDSFNVIFRFWGSRDTIFGYEQFDDIYANEAYDYTITIADIVMIEGKRENYEVHSRGYASGVITPRAIEVQTGTKAVYYTGQDFSYAVVELLEGYSLVEGHVFTYLGYEPTIIYGYEGIKTKENNVPFGVVDEMGRNVSPNYFTQNIIYGTISTIPRPITITTESREMQYNGQAQSWSGYSTNATEYLEDGLTALIEGHEIKKTSKRTKVTDVTDDIGVDNVLGFKIVDEDGNEVTEFYNIEYIYGKLKIIPYEIHVSLSDQIVQFTGNIYNPATFIVSKDSEGNILKGLPVVGDSFYFETFVQEIGDIGVVPEEPTDPSINTYPAVPGYEYDVALDIDPASSELLYVGNYIVYIENLVVNNLNGENVTSNYVIVYDTEESFNVEITKATLTYQSNNASKIWDGAPISEQGYNFNEWEFLNVYIVVEEFTTLNPYDPVTGDPVYFANTENIHQIKVFDRIYGNDITESCLNIVQYHGMLEFTDTLSIQYTNGKQFDNYKFELKEDENGRYLDELYIYGNFNTVYNANLKVYVTDILDEYGNSVTEILNADNYTFVIDQSKTKVISNGVDLTEMIELRFEHFNYTISPKPIIVRPKEKIYTYDGNDINYEGFDIAETLDGFDLCEGHVFYLNTTITHENSLNKMNKKQTAIITDIAVYEVDENGNKKLYEEWQRNYTVCYFDKYTNKIINKDIIPDDYDEEKGSYVKRFEQADLCSTFRCNKIKLTIQTPASQKDYDGEYIKFDSSQCVVLNPGAILPNHEFKLPLGYWLSAKTYSNLKGFVNTIGTQYWGVYQNGDLLNPVTQFYELEQTSKYCGTIVINKNTIVIQSSNVQKHYDGSPLTNYKKELSAADFYLAEGYKLADGDYINYEKSSAPKKVSITYVGQIQNEFNVKIYNKYGQDVTSAYDIIKEWGYLIVTPSAN